MADDEQATGTDAPSVPKRKRVVSQATLDMLAAGRAKRDANRKAAAAAKVTADNGQELVLLDREQVRKDRESRHRQDDEDREQERSGNEDRESRRDDEPQHEDRESRTAASAVKPRSIDDVVNKVRARAGEPPVASEYPSVEEVARTTEIYGAGGVIPPTEIDPVKRDKPTMGRVDLTDDAPPDLSGDKIRTLADLFSRFPVGDGQYEIQVVRRAPSAWGGFQCKGEQRPIRRYLTTAQFTDEYGGGEYLLTVFGPPRRGGIMDPQTRLIRPKALTEPVLYTVPLSYPPNPQACVFEEHEEDDGQDGYDYDDGQETDMRFQPQFQVARTGRPNTPADAKVLEVQIGATERAEERVRQRERELTEQIQNSHKDAIPLINNAIGAVTSAAERTEQVLQRQVEAAEARAEREREAAERRASEQARPDPSAELAARTMDRMVTMLTSKSPEQGAELARLAQQYAGERENMQAAHARELERVQSHANESVRAANDRCDARIREIEARCDERIKNTESAAAREVREAREAATREKADLERIYTSRLNDEARNHEREIRAQETGFTSRMEVQKTAFEMRIAQKDDEIRRLGGDAERFRAEAEKNRDLPARMQEFATAAEAMGFAKDGGAPEPASWKELAGQVGLQLVAKLPEIVQSAGEAVRGAKPDLSQQAQMQQMHEAAQHTQPRRMIPPLPTRSGVPFGGGRMIFNTEDGPEFHNLAPSQEGHHIIPRDPAPPVTEPMMAPAGLQVQQPMVDPGSPPQYVYPPEQMQQPTWQTQAPPQQQAAPRAAPQAQQQQAAPVPPASSGEAISAEQIMTIAPHVEKALADKQPPEILAAAMVAQLGKPAAAAVASALSVERVVATVMQHNPASALVRRDGQKYLKAVWAAVKAQAA